MPSYSCSGGYASPAYSCFGSMAAPTDFFPGYGSPYATPMPAYYGGSSDSGAACCGATAYSTSPMIGSGGIVNAPIMSGGVPTTPYFGESGFPVVPSFGNPPSAGDLPGGVIMPPPSSPYSTPMPIEPPKVMESRSGLKNQLPPPGAPVSNRATIVFRVPADAKLYAEGQLLNLTSGERSFVTPELPSGREYSYTFKIEYERAGRTLSETQKVTIGSGKTVSVVFDDLSLGLRSKLGPTAVAKVDEPAKPVSSERYRSNNPFRDPETAPASPNAARLTIKLPQNATLFIDGVKNDRTELEREFTTPPLPTGREFSYLLKVETIRDGRPEEITQKVVFRAGESVPVDFTGIVAERNAGK
jgi:uncharacterized protein (TIGR03000 family)